MVPRGWTPPAPLPREVPFWVYLVGVVVGAIIMGLIILLLIKIGFFRRKKTERDTSASPAGEDQERTASQDLQIAAGSAEGSAEDQLETGSNDQTSSTGPNDSSDQNGYSDPNRQQESQEPLLEG